MSDIMLPIIACIPTESGGRVEIWMEGADAPSILYASENWDVVCRRGDREAKRRGLEVIYAVQATDIDGTDGEDDAAATTELLARGWDAETIRLMRADIGADAVRVVAEREAGGIDPFERGSDPQHLDWWRCFHRAQSTCAAERGSQ